MVDAIIIPDIHGRKFWKDAVTKYENTDTLIIFLGDYIDPYYDEKIPYHDAFENFEEIIKFKRDNPDRVVLLIGNHDLHYISKYADCRGSRYDSLHASEINELFLRNIDLFKIMHVLTTDSKTFVFSHAGIMRNWLDKYAENIGADKSDDIYNLYSRKLSDIAVNLKINERFADISTRDDVITALSAISYRRGGYNEYGSMVWEDLSAFILQKNREEDDAVQIFGHTQLKDQPVNKNNLLYDLDVRRGFMIKESEVCELDGIAIPVTELSALWR